MRLLITFLGLIPISLLAVDTSILDTGKAFLNNNTVYQRVSNATITPQKPESEGSIQGLNVNPSSVQPSYQLIEKKGPYSIYLINNNGGASALSQSTSAQTDTDSAIVLNKQTGNLGVLSGSIIVKLNNMNAAEDIANKFELTIALSLTSLKTIVLTGADGYGRLIDLHQELSNYPGVITAELEIIEQLAQPL